MKNHECTDPERCPHCMAEELQNLQHPAVVYVAPDGTMKLFRLEPDTQVDE
jgi:hypothetical protein